MSERVRKSTPDQAEAEQATGESTAAPGQAGDIVEELDALLDRIDEVLESDAEEFVKNYVQKGGQ
jgi:ubiquitin-like protein Pup